MVQILQKIGKVIVLLLLLAGFIGGTWYFFLRDSQRSVMVKTQAIFENPFAELIIPEGVDDATKAVFEQKIAGTKAMYETSPKEVSTWVAIGNLYRLFKKPEQAVLAYKKTIEIDPNNLVGYRNIAEVYVNDLQNYEQAATYYRLALTRNYADPTLYLSYGFLLERNLHRPEDAEKLYVDGLPRTRYDRDVLLNLVELYKRMGNEGKYVEYGKVLLQRYPNDALIQSKYRGLVK